jgi:histidine triad (HIT) family protein
MFNHAPSDYQCPICPAIKGVVNEYTLIRPGDIIYQDKMVTAFINSFFVGNNPGHVIIIPNKHYENLYDLPENYANAVINTAKKIAIVMKHAYKCDGITIRQNNESASGQHAFHYHLYIFPRYMDDSLDIYTPQKKTCTSNRKIEVCKENQNLSTPDLN